MSAEISQPSSSLRKISGALCLIWQKFRTIWCHHKKFIRHGELVFGICAALH